ncbi:MAG TPA: response regulator, partial [Candidatus Udaeobacter sp.]|nr:response regulator [Candidatus Udaeobacter sp.]
MPRARLESMGEHAAPRILVADDDTDVLSALKLLLRNEGWEVVTATSPSLTLRAVESSEFDVALLDLN